jgi:hypothetical protein
MSKPTLPKSKVPSLADFLVRYDLQTMQEEARLDYQQATSGSPRHLDQKDIAARFMAAKRPPAKPAHE